MHLPVRSWFALLLLQILRLAHPALRHPIALLQTTRGPRLPGSVLRRSKPADTARTDLSGSGGGWSPFFVNRPWRTISVPWTLQAGSSWDDCRPSADVARGAQLKRLWSLRSHNWKLWQLSTCMPMLPHCSACWIRRSPPMTAAGFCLTRWVELETHRGIELNSTARCCYAGHCCLDCIQRQPRRWLSASCSMREAAYTVISFCSSGDFCRMMTGTGSSNGTKGGLESNWILRRARPPWMQDRNLPAAQEARVPQAVRRWEGRPGPKSWDSVTVATQQHFHVLMTIQRPCVACSRMEPCHIVDTRVGGNFGRCPPEAQIACPKHFPNTAKLNDPFSYRTSSQATGSPSTFDEMSRTGSLRHHVPSELYSFYFPPSWLVAHRHQECLASCAMLSPRVISVALGMGEGYILLAVLCIRQLWKGFFRSSGCWRCFRVRPGSYRRRFCVRLACLGLRTSRHKQEPRAGMNEYSSYNPPGSSRNFPAQGRPLRLGRIGVLLFSLLSRSCLGAPAAVTPPQPNPSLLSVHGHMAERLSAARKRAFKRAQIRVMQHGSTTYRGQRHTMQSLSLQYVGRARPRPPPNLPAVDPGLLRVITWNCGGLHTSRYAELMTWLNDQTTESPHIVLIQECHWPHSLEFNSDKWIHLYSGMGQAHGGVMIIVSRAVARPDQVRFAELVPGRMLHARLALEPPIDVLCMYQHAWASSAAGVHAELSRSDFQSALLEKRQQMWNKLRSWISSIPARNTLLVGGDMNCSLLPSHPNVGTGVQSHKSLHPDQSTFQQLITSKGLIAMNTWGKAGSRAGTFLQLQQHSVQIDYLFTRLPCHAHSMRAKALHTAPVVHPTGLRHVPVQGCLKHHDKPRQPFKAVLKPHHIQQTTRDHPDLAHKFESRVMSALQGQPVGIVDLDACLRTAWMHSSAEQKGRPTPDSNSTVPEVSLRSYWQAKQQVRQAQHRIPQFLAPLVWQFSDAPADVVTRCFPRAVQSLRPLFGLWRAVQRLHGLDKNLRKRVKERKLAKVDSLISEAQELDHRGIGALHLVARRLRPKQPKTSIHFRTSEGLLMSEQQEIQCLKSFFSDLYQSQECKSGQHVLEHALDIQEWEVADAIRSLPARKARPPGQSPALLWRMAADQVAPVLRDNFQRCLQPGRLQFPPRWHDSYLTLLAKPGKPPNCPANLRPINLLPAEAKILARIAAKRLYPYVAQAVEAVPQFAYVMSRQCSDAIDRVLSHCMRVRSQLHSRRRTVSEVGANQTLGSLQGGLQLSLDLAKAYDRLPRRLLRAALEGVQAPGSLITLILFIHDNAQIVINRHQSQERVSMGPRNQTRVWTVAVVVDYVHVTYPQ